MKKNIYCIPLLVLLFIPSFWSCKQTNRSQQNETGKIEWPDITQETKPWTRWWWHGSAVTKKGLTAALESYEEAGLGGVEITPIYGVKGEEEHFIEYLSSQWMEKLTHTLAEAKRLNMGVDLANASGWPFGGPWVDQEIACKYMTSKTYRIKGGETFSDTIVFIQKPILGMQDNKQLKINEIKEPVTANDNLQEYAFFQVRYPNPLPVIQVTAHKSGEKGFTEKIDLTDQVVNGKLTWKVPEGDWVICALFQGLHGKMVERAGPGGEGDVIDHFSTDALDKYLNYFDQKFKGYDLSYLRYYFNDSYEVDDASDQSNWTPRFFKDFQRINGYDLRDYIPALLGLDSTEMNSRVIYDYRMAISELLLENYTKRWQKWAAKQGKGIRNQSHGSPANVLDLYAASDIPEIEGDEIVNLKSAASAAHVTGKKLVSSESATWLGEHFESNWGNVKNVLDKLFLSGVNHVFYHGTAYSPQEAQWPGWLFYAAVHFTPTNSLWNDFKALNQYVSRTQSFLQAGYPSNDILLFNNIADYWSEAGNEMLKHFHSDKMFNFLSLKVCGNYLTENGYSWDAISDKQLQDVSYKKGKLLTCGNAYKIIIIPETKLMTYATFEKLIYLAKEGASILFVKNLPLGVPGLADKEKNTKKMEKLKKQLTFTREGKIQVASYGKGRVIIFDEILEILTYSELKPETFYTQGLQSIRRLKEDGNYYYFIKNTSSNKVEDWIPLQVDYASAAYYNPMTGVTGYAPSKTENGKTILYICLDPEESLIIETFKDSYTGNPYPYYQTAGDSILLVNWRIDFVKGGPELPKSISIDKLQSWTNYGENYVRFSGTATYTTLIPVLTEKPEVWLLKLGKVNESAVVYLNDKYMGTLLNPPYNLEIPGNALRGNDTLKVAVSNLMANRIISMDKQDIAYRKFYNINFSARKRENRGEDGNFTTLGWSPKDSGLSGKVTLTPLKKRI